MQCNEVFLCSRLKNMNAAPVASHSCTTTILLNASGAIGLLFYRPCVFCNAVLQTIFKSNLSKNVGVFPAEYKSEPPSVRRNKSSIRDILLGTKNVFLNFIHNSAAIFLPLLLFFCNAETIAQEGSANKLVINFKNMVGGQLLQTDSVYTNTFGETFTVRTFKYYISNIVLSDDATGKKQFYKDQYFLVDEDDSTSKKIELTTTLNSITSVNFLLGVDSLKNVSGIQTGNLDPAKGMFWTWNTGYVMAKLEGNSPVAKTPQHAFSYHVGGYKKNEQTVRQINLVLPQKLICENAAVQLTVQANILAWFNTMNAIKIGDVAFCHEPGMLAVRLADNYSKMFKVVQ